MQNKEISDLIHKKLKSHITETNDHAIGDIHDGKLHKLVVESDPKICTFTMSTDGAPLFHVSKRGFWPLQVFLNFLPPHLRFKYVLLCGVMVLRSEPKPDLMNLFIGEFIKQANYLSEGIRIKLAGHNEEINIRLVPFCVVADSVARPILQNRFQFNGYFGCSYCYDKGLYVSKVGMKYPFLESESILRTHSSHMKDIAEVLARGSSVRGVKGESAFCSAPSIDMVWGFPIDYMHNSILGITEQLWNYWNENVFSPAERKAIDELILQIQPPRDLHRAPQTITNKSLWKATHWKAWLLYYSIPILSQFLPKNLLEHYALFVNSTYTLLKTEITNDELIKCEEDLMIFVANYQILDGVEKMTFNVHIVMHAVTSVRLTGPYWATSVFPFENNIYCLKQMINGPKSVEQQMAKKSLIRLCYFLQPRNLCISEVASKYCQKLFNTKVETKSALKLDNITFLGPSAKNKFSSEKEYERCIVNMYCIYSSIKYLRSKKFNDTVIELKNGKIAQITKIVTMTNKQCHFEIRELIVEPFLVNQMQVLHIWKVKENVEHNPILVCEIKCKVVALIFENCQYVCKIPNTIEAQ